MAQLLIQGTNFVDFVGHHAFIGGQGGLQAVRITEWKNPKRCFGHTCTNTPTRLTGK